MICVIWGTTWLAIKLSISSVPPFLSAGLRFSIATVLILVILKFRGYKYKFSLRETLFLVLIGLGSFSVPYGLVYWAEGRVTSGLTAVTFAVMPFFAAVMSRIYLKTRDLTPPKVTGIIVGFAGLIVIFWNDLNIGSVGTIEGILAVVLSAFLNAVVAVGVKKYGSDIDPIYINLIPMALGAITLLLTSMFVENWSTVEITPTTVLSIVYLAVFGSVVAFALYFYLLKHISVVMLSLTSFITPLLALISGALFLGEKSPSGTLAGSAMILVGVLMMSLVGEKNTTEVVDGSRSEGAPSK